MIDKSFPFMFFGTILLMLSYNSMCQIKLCKNSGKYSQILSIEVAGCTSKGCDFYSGDIVRGVVKIKTLVPSTKITTTATVKAIFWSVKIPGVDPNGCNMKGMTCPLATDSTVSLEFSIPIPTLPFKISGSGQIEMVNEKKQSLACATFKGTVRRR
ncbi:hypothetical protein MXB_420 [Myxobolus squamalis]|nr:hypothetical protein MXB_420 [Myxobolus squamalis]